MAIFCNGGYSCSQVNRDTVFPAIPTARSPINHGNHLLFLLFCIFVPGLAVLFHQFQDLLEIGIVPQQPLLNQQAAADISSVAGKKATTAITQVTIPHAARFLFRFFPMRKLMDHEALLCYKLMEF